MRTDDREPPPGCNRPYQACNNGPVVESTKYGQPIVRASINTTRQVGSAPAEGFHDAAGRTGARASPNAPAISHAAPTARTTRCVAHWRFSGSRATSRCEYAYPENSTNWKNSMQVVQTAELPPNHGRIALLNSGCTPKSRNALRKMVPPNNTPSQRLDCKTTGMGTSKQTRDLGPSLQ